MRRVSDTLVFGFENLFWKILTVKHVFFRFREPISILTVYIYEWEIGESFDKLAESGENGGIFCDRMLDENKFAL